MNNNISSSTQYFTVLKELVKRNTKNQYRNSMLGMLWTVLNPLLTMCVYWLVFASLNKDDPTFHLYMLGGQIIFQFFSTATTQSMLSIVDNSGTINRVRLPYSIYPLSNVLSSLVSFLFSFLAFFAVLIITDIFSAGLILSWKMFGILLMMPALILFTYGVSLVLSALYVYFRDIKHFYSVFLTLLMFLSGIFYKFTTMEMPKAIMKVISINPVYRFINYFRFMMNLSCDYFVFWEDTLIIYAMALIMLFIGWLIFRKAKKNFILYI